jgi:beta propeller repeat protein
MKNISRNRVDKRISEKRSVMIALATVTVIVIGLFSGFAFRPANASVIQFYEDRITSDPASQENPAVYGDTVVYQDNRNGNWDIYMVKYGYGETRITTNAADQTNPRIYGDKIVYEDNRNGNPDIYMYDLSTHTETQITNNPLAQVYPAIDGNRIVWQDTRNTNWDSLSVTWDIYMYDLSTQTETRVTTSGVNTHPAVSGNRIAYMKDRDVCYFDLSTGSEVRLTNLGATTDQHAEFPAICGSHVIWHQNIYSFGGWHYIAMKDVVTGATWNTSTAASVMQDVMYPDISELYAGAYYIVYEDQYGGHIYLYNTLTETIYQLTSAQAVQKNPRVSSSYIVYQDNRNGNWDIYMTMVGYVLGAPPQPTLAVAMRSVEIIERRMADPAQIPTRDMNGANSKVQENRRKALLNKLDGVIATIQAAGDSTDPAGKTAHYQGAIGQLNSILDKTDGCAFRGTPDTTGTGFTPDWIIACESQALIEPLIEYSVALLQTLLQLAQAQ